MITDHQEDLQYFRRLTWFLAERTGLSNDGTIMNSMEDSGDNLDPPEEITEDEDSLQQDPLNLDTQLRLLQTLAILSTRTDKIVTVALGRNGAVFHEEEKDEEEVSTFTFKRNPRRDIDTTMERDSSAFWVGDYGIKLSSLVPAKNNSNVSPHRPLKEYLAGLLEFLRQIDSGPADQRNGRIAGLRSYILRVSFPKLHRRISYHSRDFRPANPQNPRKKEKLDGNFVDYSVVIVPLGLQKSARIAHLFQGNALLDGRQRAIIDKWMYEKKGTIELGSSYATAISCNQFEKGLLRWLTATFLLSRFDINQPASVHEYLGTLIFGFISGIHTLAYTTSFEDLNDTNSVSHQLSLPTWKNQPGIGFGVETLAFMAVGISGILTGELLRRHLELVCKSEEKEGYKRWLGLITEHFTAVNTISSRNYLKRILSSQSFVVDITQHGLDSLMLPFAKCLERMKLTPGLSDLDSTRLIDLLSRLPNNDNFSGTSHCEVILLLLVYVARSSKSSSSFPQELVNHFKAIDPTRLGISKRCCLICTTLLQIVGRRLGMIIDTCGSHSKITPCSLPPWCPPEIIKEAIAELEEKVRPLLLKKVEELCPVFKRDAGSSSASPQTAPLPASDIWDDPKTIDME